MLNISRITPFDSTHFLLRSRAPLSHIDSEAVEVGINSAGNRPARSNPMNMPLSGNGRSAVPVLIESGSCSTYDNKVFRINSLESLEVFLADHFSCRFDFSR